MKYLVTGASGFAGKAVTAELEARGMQWIGIGRAHVDLAHDRAGLAAMLAKERPDVIFHLAGGVHKDDPFTFNIAPMRTVLSVVTSERVFSLGSAAEYGDVGSAPISEGVRENPVSDYGIAKLAQSRLCVAAQRRGLRVHALRLFNVLGPGMPGHLGPARFASEALASTGVMQVGNLSPVRDYLEMSEAARCLVDLSLVPFADPVVNVCSGRGVTMRAVLDAIIAATAKRIDVQTHAGLVRGAEEIPVSVGDATRLRQLLGRAPAFDLNAAAQRLVSVAG